MEANKRKHNSQVEINDLIDDAVNNALARRKEALGSEDALLAVSDEEAKNIAGGIAATDYTTTGIRTPIITGKIATTGIIATVPETY
jgi:flagellar biosynthesis regulator FlaF